MTSGIPNVGALILFVSWSKEIKFNLKQLLIWWSLKKKKWKASGFHQDLHKKQQTFLHQPTWNLILVLLNNILLNVIIKVY